MGKAIPLSGLIMALADAYDAPTSKRAYKEAFAHRIAGSMIRKDAGTHFDPNIVEAFVQTGKQLIQTRRQYDDAFAVAA